MNRLTVEIVEYPLYSYKLLGKDIHKYKERALEEARDLYLSLYDSAYRSLMGSDFNPLWTPDTKSVNDLDFKDDFGRVSYFYFNICLLKILSDEFDLKVIDTTSSEFTDQKYLYAFLQQNGIDFETTHKEVKRFYKHKIKRFVVGSVKNFPGSIASKTEELKDILSLQPESIQRKSEGKIIYLYVHSVGSMRLQEYLDWRYSELQELLKENGYQIIIVSTIDFKDAESVEYPFININRLVSKFELFKSFLKSVFTKWKVIGYKIFKSINPNLDIARKYFLKNLPTQFFYPIRELYGLDHLFKTKGRGLLIIKGPVNNKGAASLFYKARKYNLRSLVIAPRILTSTRFSNQFIQSHRDDQFPEIFPNSMIVHDQVSYEAIERQNHEITLYPVGVDYDERKNMDEKKHNPLSLTLVLQKKKEIEDMVKEVTEAIRGMDDVVLHLKIHPTFPIPEELVKEYKQISNVHILPKKTSLRESIEISDVCLTSYSSAVLEFAKKGKPIIWLRNATANSLFFAELQNRIGLSVNNSGELKEIILKMKDETDYYSTECRLQYSQFREIIFRSDAPVTHSLRKILDEELEKV